MSAAVREQAGAGERSDRDLVACVRRGDDRAFERLYERYQSRIVAYVASMLRDPGRAEDVTQEIFMSALRRMRQTERPIAFRPWIYEIARNACIDQFRRSGRAQECSYEAGEEVDDPRLASAAPGPDSAVDAKEEIAQLCSAMGGLSASHHRILVLRELEGLSYREIGERMNMTRPAVESTLFRARRRLSDEYEELISGRRCERVQGLLAAVADGAVLNGESRRLARHLSHCQPCRRHAHEVGVAHLLPARQALPGRLAVLLPLPGFLRRRGGAGTPGQSAGLVGQWSGSLAPVMEPLAGPWSKAVAAALALTVAGVGTGAVTDERTSASPPKPGPQAPAVSAGKARGMPTADSPVAATGAGTLVRRPAAAGDAAASRGWAPAHPRHGQPGTARRGGSPVATVVPASAWDEVTAGARPGARPELPASAGAPGGLTQAPPELGPPVSGQPPDAPAAEIARPEETSVPEVHEPSVAVERPGLTGDDESDSRRRDRRR